MPREVYESPNKYLVSVIRWKGVILHSTRSGRRHDDFSLGREYHLTVDYMMRRDTVSSHRVIGYVEGQHAQLVRDDWIAWHASKDNPYYLGIEFTQPTPQDPYSDWQIEVGLAVVRSWAQKFGFPLDRAHVRRHQDTEQGRRNGKSDPGDMFPYEEFLRRLQQNG